MASSRSETTACFANPQRDDNVSINRTFATIRMNGQKEEDDNERHGTITDFDHQEETTMMMLSSLYANSCQQKQDSSKIVGNGPLRVGMFEAFLA